MWLAPMTIAVDLGRKATKQTNDPDQVAVRSKLIRFYSVFKTLYTLNLEFFLMILFSRIALEDIFAMLKIRN